MRAPAMALWRRLACVLALVVASALIAAGCGGSADSASANGGVVLHFMTNRDQTGLYDKIAERCSKASGGKYQIELVLMGPSTDAAREQMTRRLAAGDDSIDLLHLDVVWTAEFADAGWLVDLTERVRPLESLIVGSALDSARYKDKYWALPVGTNAALLYYRSDLVKTAPTTWEELATEAKRVRSDHSDMSGFVFQGAPYEGGTVDSLEFIYSAGAEPVSKDSTEATFTEGDGTVTALTWLQSLTRDGLSPKTVATYQEEDARMAFQNGNAVFMRNWPYAWALMNTDEASKVQGKFAVAPLPAFEGHTSSSVIGGMNWAISGTSKHPDESWQALECMAGADAQKERALVKGELPVLTSVYDDPEIKEKIPFIGESLAALQTARVRPVTPYYNDVTSVIYKAYNDVLGGRLSPKDAADRMDDNVQKALDGEPEI